MAKRVVGEAYKLSPWATTAPFAFANERPILEKQTRLLFYKRPILKENFLDSLIWRLLQAGAAAQAAPGPSRGPAVSHQKP